MTGKEPGQDQHSEYIVLTKKNMESGTMELQKGSHIYKIYCECNIAKQVEFKKKMVTFRLFVTEEQRSKDLPKSVYKRSIKLTHLSQLNNCRLLQVC